MFKVYRLQGRQEKEREWDEEEEKEGDRLKPHLQTIYLTLVFEPVQSSLRALVGCQNGG